MSHDALRTRRLVLKHSVLMFKVVHTAREQPSGQRVNSYNWGSSDVTVQPICCQVNVSLIMSLVILDVQIPRCLV